MERVTYPSDAVRNVLDKSYVRLVLDLEANREVAAMFDPNAIPVAIVLNLDGTELGRKVGFVEPDLYAEWLAGLSGN